MNKTKTLLTKRETEIIRMLADGKTVAGIGAILGISVKTVDTHKTNLMRKLDIHNRAALVKYAIKNDLVKL